MFRKDYTTVIGRMLTINPFLEDSFIKVGTDIAYSEEVCAFVDSVPEVGQKQYKKFVDRRLMKCKRLASGTIKKNNFLISAKSTAKESEKLRVAALFRPSLCAMIFKIEMSGLSECFIKIHQMYHCNKSQLLEIFDPTPSLTLTLKKDALILDFSPIVNSQAAVTTANIFNEFADGITKFVENLSSGCSRIDTVWDNYFDNSLKSHTREARSCRQFFPFTEASNIPNDFQGNF